MAMKVLHKRSTSNNLPTGETLKQGEIAVNYSNADPFLSIRKEDGSYVRISSDEKWNEAVANVDKKFDDYLPESGGTLTQTKNATSLLFLNTAFDPYISFQKGNSVVGHIKMFEDSVAYVKQSDGSTNTLIHSGNIGNQSVNYATSAGNANTLGGIGWDGFIVDSSYPKTSTNNWNIHSGMYRTSANSEGLPMSNNGNHVIHCNWDANAANQIFLSYSTDLLSFRRKEGNVWKNWKTIAFTDSNVASATIARSVYSPNGREIAVVNDDSTVEAFGSVAYYTYVDGKTLTFRYGNSYTTAMTINSSGNVSIGSADLATDKRKLYVGSGGSHFLSYISAEESQNVELGKYVLNSTMIGADVFGMQIWSQGDGKSRIQVGRTDGDATAYSLLLQPLGGNVGIGTTNPVFTLDVSGNINGNAYYARPTKVGGVNTSGYFRFGGFDESGGLKLQFGSEDCNFEILDKDWTKALFVVTPSGDLSVSDTISATTFKKKDGTEVSYVGHTHTDYLSTGGGTLTQTTNSTSLLFKNTSYNPYISFQKGNSVVGHIKMFEDSVAYVKQSDGSTNTLIHSGNIGKYTVLNGIADGNTDFSKLGSGIYKTVAGISNVPFDSAGNSIIHCAFDENAATQLFLRYNADYLYYRRRTAGVWQDWKQIAFTDSTVDNANKLGGVDASSYLTGITKKMVTDALGYTPPTTYSAGSFININSSNAISVSTGTSSSTVARGDHGHSFLSLSSDLVFTSGEGNDCGDIVWYYHNGQEKCRIYTANNYTSAKGLLYRVYDENGTQLYSNALSIEGHTHSEYITGITKTMVTNALGYTPPTTNTTYSAGSFISINSSNAISVSTGTSSSTVARGDHSHSYMPLSGGTFTGGVTGTSFSATTSISAKDGFFQTSDETLKDFYDEIDVDFEKLKTIPKRYYKWKSDPDGDLEIGTSAQKVQELYPELVGGKEDEKLSVDYSKLSVIALKAVDKLYEENVLLKTENENFKSEINDLKQRLEKMERLIESLL